MDGTYVFNNPSLLPRVQGLFYPFSVDSLHPFPSEIEIWVKGETVPFEKIENGIVFRIKVPGRGKTTTGIYYEQSCLDNTACYILTSTAAWDKPLEKAHFEIRIPDKFDLDRITYEIEETIEDHGIHVHKFSKQNFMPDKDLCLGWRLGELR